MRLHSPILVTALAVVAVGLALPGSPAVPAANPAAEVRFTNSLTEDATLKANGVALFSDVDAGTTSEWSTVIDSLIVFTLTPTGEGKPPAKVTQQMTEGARYTVTATASPDGDPTLSIKQEPPMPAPDSTSDGS